MITTIKTSPKSENINFRLSPDAKELIEKAIVVSGQSLTEFATRSLIDTATQILEREYLTILSDRDRNRLLALLDADEEPNDALRQAAEMHKRLIIE